MSVFLIQTNGREINEDAKPEYIRGAMGPTFVDEPLRHHRYFNANPYWKREGYERRDAWKRATEGDTALLYCSSSVEKYPACISHILPIEDKQIDSEGALLEFETSIEIEPKINYQDIQRLVDQGELSEKMGYCGQQGFNFTQVANSDLNKVKELTSRVWNEEDVRQALSVALETVIEEDDDLLRFDVNERSITHRLAVYLGEEIDGEWDVDIEYNREGEDEVSKTIPMECLKSKITDDVDPEDLDAKTVYPDVIVHNRGEQYENLLVIEAKKSGVSGEYDREKITAYKEELQYEHGVFVKFKGIGSGEDPGYCCDWYPFEK